ncbi:hypothetical protein H8S20_19575 [Clostridium sp. NSJ-6]|uniref:Uncharacterized protein n=1 Tax=Clostridium hominis TaxID=2763036 RepID=A0ABR7DHV9_9CLOT|nr:hypothetical protein [Clostridium hominis]MBC5631030.1 hypothetical protein [Clostridium hominis]
MGTLKIIQIILKIIALIFMAICFAEVHKARIHNNFISEFRYLLLAILMLTVITN